MLLFSPTIPKSSGACTSRCACVCVYEISGAFLLFPLGSTLRPRAKPGVDVVICCGCLSRHVGVSCAYGLGDGERSRTMDVKMGRSISYEKGHCGAGRCAEHFGGLAAGAFLKAAAFRRVWISVHLPAPHTPATFGVLDQPYRPVCIPIDTTIDTPWEGRIYLKGCWKLQRSIGTVQMAATYALQT